MQPGNIIRDAKLSCHDTSMVGKETLDATKGGIRKQLTHDTVVCLSRSSKEGTIISPT